MCIFRDFTKRQCELSRDIQEIRNETQKSEACDITHGTSVRLSALPTDKAEQHRKRLIVVQQAYDQAQLAACRKYGRVVHIQTSFDF
ncbi:MAG: hypothetical protein JNM78_05225 [Cyclobacteriaceae bacterium]|nr:hypothetical protein [Cyclobacteriaceae bacterium]